MAEMTECPKCGKVGYSFLHSCRFAGLSPEDIDKINAMDNRKPYDDDDLREWAERIWAAVEYRGNGVQALKRVLEEIEARS